MRFYRQVKKDIGTLNRANIERYIRRQGWEAEYYGEGCEPVNKYIKSLGRWEYACGVDSFVHKDGLRTVIFVRKTVPEDKKPFLLLHEAAHLLFGHNLAVLDWREELEANRFAERFTQVRKIPWAWIVPLLAVAACVVFFLAIALSGASQPGGTGRFYITPNGTKYHLSGCFYIRGKDNVAEVTLEQALRLGKQPCKVCFPDPPADG